MNPPLACFAAQERLQAFHDGELPLEGQIAVEQHLDGCWPCVWEARRLAAISEGLRCAVLFRQQTTPAPSDVQPRVLSRLKAEQDASFPATFTRLFEDLHLVWAALGASVATAACLAVIVGLLHFLPPERADSLAGLLSIMSSPGSNENPVRMDGRIQLPRVFASAAMPAMLINDAPELDDDMFALAAVLTREGRLTDLEVLLANDRDRQEVLTLLDAVSAARFEPARFGDAPVAVNMVWLLARTTVRARS